MAPTTSVHVYCTSIHRLRRLTCYKQVATNWASTMDGLNICFAIIASYMYVHVHCAWEATHAANGWVRCLAFIVEAMVWRYMYVPLFLCTRIFQVLSYMKSYMYLAWEPGEWPSWAREMLVSWNTCTCTTSTWRWTKYMSMYMYMCNVV